MREIDEALNIVSERVIGAAIEVHKTLGPGHLEKIYERALSLELDIREIPFERQCGFSTIYKDREIGRSTVDLIVADSVVVELKAAKKIMPAHEAQIISYLKVSRNDLGLLLNFGASTMKDGVERIVYTKE
jgi:GxxExxY protein